MGAKLNDEEMYAAVFLAFLAGRGIAHAEESGRNSDDETKAAYVAIERLWPDDADEIETKAGQLLIEEAMTTLQMQIEARVKEMLYGEHTE